VIIANDGRVLASGNNVAGIIGTSVVVIASNWCVGTTSCWDASVGGASVGVVAVFGGVLASGGHAACVNSAGVIVVTIDWNEHTTRRRTAGISSARVVIIASYVCVDTTS
jgi:hypothetical protein